MLILHSTTPYLSDSGCHRQRWLLMSGCFIWVWLTDFRFSHVWFWLTDFRFSHVWFCGAQWLLLWSSSCFSDIMTQIRCESTEQLVHFFMVTGSCYCLSCQPILETEMRERGVGEMGEKGERWDNWFTTGYVFLSDWPDQWDEGWPLPWWVDLQCPHFLSQQQRTMLTIQCSVQWRHSLTALTAHLLLTVWRSTEMFFRDRSIFVSSVLPDLEEIIRAVSPSW